MTRQKDEETEIKIKKQINRDKNTMKQRKKGIKRQRNRDKKN